MQTDVVCGMRVDPVDAPAKSAHKGQTFYFCSTECKKKFEADPERYLKNQPQEQYAR
ncbi:MAG TPA: YHS domain-containing protein [Vicinamibacterales bacterium]|nr:YHS domain-containing protein [Vicinamibacterales bacterium]